MHLEHYFELSKPDATRALAVYRIFVKQTEAVVQYLSLARSHEHSTRLEIPKIKHAPTSLAASLEEYLNDKDFEVNRRQYLAEKEAKKNGGKVSNGSSKAQEPKPASSATTTSQPPALTRNPSAPLIDLFASIEDNQQTMATQPNMQQQYPQTGFQQQAFQIPQQTDNMGFAQQQQQPFSPQSATNPFQMQQQQQQVPQIQMQPPQLQTQFTGAGFGGYTPQTFSPQNNLAPIPQNGVMDFSQQPQQQMQQHMQIPTIAEPLQSQHTSTNPFRQSMLPSPTGTAEPKLINNPTGASSLSRSATNPFAKHTTGFQSSQSPTNPSPFAQPPVQPSPFAQMQQPQQLQPLQPLQPMPTGTNPFARQPSPQSATSPQGGLTVNATGSTNPFRQSAFVNQQTGQGWQSTGQGTLGGMNMDQVPTTNVFPRPGQQQTQNFLG
jgi:hypothetical protein